MRFLHYAVVLGFALSIGQGSFAAPSDSVEPSVTNPDQYRRGGDNGRGGPYRDDKRPEFKTADGQGRQHFRGHERGDWKIGHPIPENYRYSDYIIDSTDYPQLSSPSKYQKWIKVNNRFVLINVLTNTTLKVVPDAK